MPNKRWVFWYGTDAVKRGCRKHQKPHTRHGVCMYGCKSYVQVSEAVVKPTYLSCTTMLRLSNTSSARLIVGDCTPAQKLSKAPPKQMKPCGRDRARVLRHSLPERLSHAHVAKKVSGGELRQPAPS